MGISFTHPTPAAVSLRRVILFSVGPPPSVNQPVNQIMFISTQTLHIENSYTKSKNKTLHRLQVRGVRTKIHRLLSELILRYNF